MDDNQELKMEKLAAAETLRKISLGEVDLDEISEVLRSAELVIKNYRTEVEDLRRCEEQLQADLEKESRAVDDLTGRLAALHAENRLARDVFRTEIEGRRSILGIQSNLDLEATDMAALIREREKVQKELARVMEVE